MQGATGAPPAPEPDIGAAAMSKLRWRCRRGLLENDLLIARLFARQGGVSHAESHGLYLLMELADNDLLDLFLGRQKPTGRLDRAEVHQVLEAVRRAPLASDRNTRVSYSSSPSPSRIPP